ncbi:hypothetical protein BSKO_04343 [Bryopsis sp. KO-2023]|nr:hypothetical protein BSKO_04343 [Bryopsis sp. KO-2023]
MSASIFKPLPHLAGGRLGEPRTGLLLRAKRSRDAGVPCSRLAPRNYTTFCFDKFALSSSPALVKRDIAAKAAASAEAKTTEEEGSSWKVFLAAAITVALGVANRVTYKMALVPLNNYVFFLAQFQTFGYILIYFSILRSRYRSKLVTDEMLSVPKKPFAVIGMAEALGQVCMLIGAAKLPGALLPLFQQTMIVWQLILSAIILGRRYSVSQLMGCALVIAGGCLAGWASTSSTGSLAASPVYMSFFLVGVAFPCIAVIAKEKIFADAKEKLGGKDLDLFVVNSFGSLAQAVCVFMLLPVITSLRNIPLSGLPAYLYQGGQCFMGISPACGSNCAGAPLLPALYIACNLGFNIAALNMLRLAGGVKTMLAMSAVLPLTVLVFTMDLPYLGVAPQVGSLFMGGCALVLSGILFYNRKEISEGLKKKPT